MNLVILQDTKLVHRNLLHSYTLNDKISERKIKEINSCSTATRRIKYLGINLHNEAKDLYAENNNIPKKSKMIQADGKIYCVLGLEELILSK